jgi:hypothetical protein
MRTNENGRGALVGLAGFLLGSTGLISVRLIDVQPTGLTRAVSIALMTCGAVLAGAQVLQPPPELPESLTWFQHAWKRPTSRGWRLTGRCLSVKVAPGTSLGRRDALIEWTYLVHNRSKRVLTELVAGVVAEVAVQRTRMTLKVLEPAGSSARVAGGGSHDPLIQFLLSPPGIPPGGEAQLRWRYEWPGFADLAGDCYIQRLNDVELGAVIVYHVHFPRDVPLMRGEAFVVRRRFGFWLPRRGLAAILPKQDWDGHHLDLTYVTAVGDVMVLLYTMPANALET